MFEGDKEKYKKFLKNLENALAEADIQKRIREIVEDTKGLAAIDAVEADKQNEHDFEKNKKIKKSFDEQAQRIAELQYNVPIVMDSLVGSIESDMGIKAT